LSPCRELEIRELNGRGEKKSSSSQREGWGRKALRRIKNTGDDKEGKGGEKMAGRRISTPGRGGSKGN